MPFLSLLVENISIFLEQFFFLFTSILLTAVSLKLYDNFMWRLKFRSYFEWLHNTFDLLSIFCMCCDGLYNHLQPLPHLNLYTRDVHLYNGGRCDMHLDAQPTIRYIKRYIWSIYWCDVIRFTPIMMQCDPISIRFNTMRFNAIGCNGENMMLCNSIWYR